MTQKKGIFKIHSLCEIADEIVILENTFNKTIPIGKDCEVRDIRKMGKWICLHEDDRHYLKIIKIL